MKAMKLICVKLPTVFVTHIDNLVRRGFYSSRGQAIRETVREYLDILNQIEKEDCE